MTGINAYSNSGYRFYRQGSGFWYGLMLFCLILCVPGTAALAQEEPEFEEIAVFLYVRQIGGTDIPAYIHGQNLYLPVTNIFSFLKILNAPTPGYDTVSGFFINEQATYLIDRVNNKIQYQEKVYSLKDGDLIRTENNLYLKINYFGEIFGLECTFSFSGMSVNLVTKLELPMIKEMRQAMMRTNLKRLKGEIKPDTAIKRNFPFFHFGAADWSITGIERVNGNSNVRFNLAFGALLAGGAAQINLNFSPTEPFRMSEQNYSWHFANNDLKLFKQITLGRIPLIPNASLTAPVVGAQISNTPTTFQRSFCTYTLSDYTEPGWIVELYVNYVLVDYVKADASGYFSFEVPLVYGNSLVKLRFFGPWGEEHSREQNISIPFNFLPPNRFEYTINAGVVSNASNSRYSKVNFHYGASRRLTLGGGVEYLSAIRSGPVMPFVNLSVRLASSLLVSGEYTFGVRFKGALSYRLPADLLLELYYNNYSPSQNAITTNNLEERKAVVSLPVHTRYFSSLFRMTVNQIILPQSNYFSSELLISGAFLGISANLTTNALFLNPKNPYIISNLSLGLKLPAKIILTPQVQYILSQNRILSTKLEFEKKIFRSGAITLQVERNFVNNVNTVQAGIRYDFSIVQTNASLRYAEDGITLLESARGSMVYEGKAGSMKFSRISAVGKGGIVIVPFLDMNGNGKFDGDEQKVVGLNLKVSGGRIEKSYRDSTIRVSELEPFTTYYIELERTGFENVSWQIPKPIISITINPNQYRQVDIPIQVMGEVSGFVMFEGDTIRKGLGRMIVSFYTRDSSFVSRVMSEDDGYFNFYGLSPGTYFARLDPTQLQKVNMVSTPDIAPFEIKQSKDGDQAEGVGFVVRSRLKP